MTSIANRIAVGLYSSHGEQELYALMRDIIAAWRDLDDELKRDILVVFDVDDTGDKVLVNLK